MTLHFHFALLTHFQYCKLDLDPTGIVAIVNAFGLDPDCDTMDFKLDGPDVGPFYAGSYSE